MPVIPNDSSRSTLFPEAEVAYVFQDGAYVPVNNLEPGKGYPSGAFELIYKYANGAYNKVNIWILGENNRGM
ncbi:hypothetical protein GMMP13_20022 [Candidatus Magnetomoraceae bacterium gMMP-13]